MGISGVTLYALLNSNPISGGIGQIGFLAKAELFVALAGFIVSSVFALRKLTE